TFIQVFLCLNAQQSSMTLFWHIEFCQQFLRDWFRQLPLLEFFWCENLFPVGLRSSHRLRLVKVRIKSAEKLNIHVLVISIVIPAPQSQDAYIRLLEGIENTKITAAEAVQPAIHMPEL